MDKQSIDLARRLHPEMFTEQPDEPLYSPEDAYLAPDWLLWVALVILCGVAAWAMV